MARYRFDQIAINSTDKRKPEDKDQADYIGLEHLDSGSLKVTRWGSKVPLKGEKLVMKKGDVLFGKRNAYLRRAAISPHDGLFSAHGMVLRPKTEIVDPEFFPFFIGSDYFFDRAIKISVGSLSPTVNWRDLKKEEFDLPSIPEQKKLTKVLRAISITKYAYEDLVRQTDELVKSQFIEMFGDPITNDRGWEYKKLPEVTEIVLGSTPSTKNPEYWDGELKWITPAELTDTSFYVYDTEKHITERGAKDAGLKICPAETVLFSTRAPIGKTAIAGVDMYCNQGFKNFVCGPMIRPVFLYYLLTLKKDYFEGLGTGTTFKELSRGMLEKVSISVPPVEEQMQFENLYRQSDKSKFELQYVNRNVKEMITCSQKKIRLNR